MSMPAASVSLASTSSSFPPLGPLALRIRVASRTHNRGFMKRVRSATLGAMAWWNVFRFSITPM